MKRVSQTDRILALLRERGSAGLRATDMIDSPTADGGPPVLRVAARVGVLKDRGFVILSERLGDGSARYRLVGEPERALSEAKDRSGIEQADPGSVPSQEAMTASEGVRSAAPAESHPVGGSLFDASVFAKRGGYADTEAA